MGDVHQHADPVQQLAYRELAARYGMTMGELTEAETRVQLLGRERNALRARVQQLEAFIEEETDQDVPPIPRDRPDRPGRPGGPQQVG